MTTEQGEAAASRLWLPLRRAGAAAREMLISAAAARWKVSPDTCKAQDGGILHGARKSFLTYARTGIRRSQLRCRTSTPSGSRIPTISTIVGHDTRRFEGRDKATGAAIFGSIHACPACSTRSWPAVPFSAEN